MKVIFSEIDPYLESNDNHQPETFSVMPILKSKVKSEAISSKNVQRRKPDEYLSIENKELKKVIEKLTIEAEREINSREIENNELRN